MNLNLARVAVIGPSCAGKTEFSQCLARLRHSTHIQLDALFWGPNWTENSLEEFRERVGKAVAEPGWVSDGNYHQVRDLIWPQVTTIVWLNYPFPLVVWRALRRTISRAMTGEELFSGNHESFRRSFFSRDSILLWCVTSYHGHRRRYRELFSRAEGPGCPVIELRTPKQAATFLAAVAADV